MVDNSNVQTEESPRVPNPALKSFDRLVGTWKVSGPEIDGQVTYEWLEGGYFFVQHFDLAREVPHD